MDTPKATVTPHPDQKLPLQSTAEDAIGISELLGREEDITILWCGDFLGTRLVIGKPSLSAYPLAFTVTGNDVSFSGLFIPEDSTVECKEAINALIDSIAQLIITAETQNKESYMENGGKIQ